MIRFWAGDIATWTDETCSCGRTYPRLPMGIYGRADDMFVVRGENVNPSGIEDAIRGVAGTGDEYRIIISREKTMDELVVQVEYADGVSADNVPQIQRQLEDELKKRGLRTVIQMQPPGSLERTQFKARRIIDRRDLYDEIRKTS
jgi:phenylacetate-CoA ligase